MWWFHSPPKIVFGEDALDELSTLKENKAFIVTDTTMRELGFVDKVQLALKKRLIDDGLWEFHIFDKVEPEPSIATVKEGAQEALSFQPDLIIALGGGSCIDAAKGIWVLYEKPDFDIEGLSPLEHLGIGKKAKFVAIPTTSGTGSEATWATVLTNREEQRKAVVASYEILPIMVVLDPSLTEALPASLTAETAFDALSHAFEAVVSGWNNDFSDALALYAIRFIFEYLPKAYNIAQSGKMDFSIREKMQHAATMAGLAMSNSQIGVVHSIGHSFGAVLEIPHGKATAISLPIATEFSCKATNRFELIAKELGISATGEAAGREVANKVRELMKKVNLIDSIKGLGVDREIYKQKIGTLVEYAQMDPGTFADPREASNEDFEKLFWCAYEGTPVDF